ncbi:Peroxidasin like protein [Melipona quadrifasciata]|uniref:Peroxidasin like protein n=1 Tax=Melipona quadrifasciata TaxID=166423 RepID=A0A0M9AC65_9HYME|nr:Peroxidasin like protein [Melipona quadrifasciata]
MYSDSRVNERTSLTRPLDSPNYVEFASLLRTRKTRIRQQFQCCICATLIAIFTMALVITISYSVSHDILDASGSNLTNTSSQSTVNLTGTLKLGFAPGSGSYTLFSNPSVVSAFNSIFVSDKSTKDTTAAKLSDDEIKEGLEAGRQAVNERLFADVTALMSPLPSPSPEVRHRYAVSTCVSTGTLALAAVAELAATKRIESSRIVLGAPSAVGSFFDAGWESLGVCKQLVTPECPFSKYRTFDGSCNRPMQRGATMTPFRRILPPNYADGIETPRRAISGAELPSAREVSLKVHKPSPSSNPHFTVMLAVYGQFLDHDITATAISQGINGTSISCCPPSVGHPECFSVPVSSGDPVFDVTGRTCMDFARSAPAPQCKLGPRQQLNQVTAFIDGSAIYGSDQDTARKLREFSGGRLMMQLTPDNRTLLPPSTNPNDGCNRETEKLRGRYCFAAGDARANENLHLTTMHLLWARQHNRVAEQLAKINPSWDDETLYEESRRIVGAQLQHITYQEFIPIILGEQETNLRDLRPLKSGYRQWTADTNESGTDPSVANSFAAAAFRFAHTLLPGLMKVTDEQRGTSSYVELHRMLFNPYSLYAEGGVKSSVISATRNVIQMTSTHVTSQLTNHLFEDPVANVTVPCGLDLVSLNIQRGRDHGLPGYTKWREYCELGKVESFSDLEGHLDPQALEDISSLYKSVHDIDLYTGALAELPKADGIVGPTFTCLIADQFVRLQKGDRFWYEMSGQPHSFTEDQLAELRKTTLARLICDCSDGVTQTQAEVMRAEGPENPMMSCEDIPAPSFEPWKENGSTPPTLRATFVPVNWTTFKNNINDTIRDVVTYINSSRTMIDTDWLAFKNYINNTFSDLRDELSGLHSPKTNESIPEEKLSTDSDRLILRAAGSPSVYQDWITFKNNLVKSLNDSIQTIGGGPAAVAKWIAFKQNIVDQFADLKDQISSMKADVVPKLKMKNNVQEQALTNQNKLTESSTIKSATIPAIFDWKNFKDNIISSINDSIANINGNMPPPGDPAWITFGKDIKDRFSTFRDKIDSQRSTVAPVELATEKPYVNDDWIRYKSDIKTVNDAVNKIKNEMSPPGDPAWARYRDEIVKSFSAFKSTPSAMEFATLSSLSEISQRGYLRASPTSKFNNTQLANLTDDWLQFKAQINDSLTKLIQDIQSKKPAEVDPIAWAAFKDSAKNDFAKLKDEIASTKADWLAEISKLKPNRSSLSLQATFNKSGNPFKFDYTKFIKPVIPPDEWADFKKQINDTVMNILNTANATDRFNFDELHEMFNESFADIKNEISALRSLVADTYNNKTTADWISFQTQLNSTVKNLVDSLKKEDRIETENVMRILLEAKDKLSDLEPPVNSGTVLPTEWIQYALQMNKTISDALKNIDSQKQVAAIVRSVEPESSSSDNPKKFTDWLIVPCLVSSFHVFTMASRF